jgi:hypothetical protein
MRLGRETALFRQESHSFGALPPFLEDTEDGPCIIS